MNKTFTLALAGAASLGVLVGTGLAPGNTATASERAAMELGNFSLSLAVKDIRAAQAFYEKLDFKVVSGKLEQRWLVLQNGNTKIGLFQGMFEKNLMTFNPGWGPHKEALKEFQDVRELQRTLKARGIRPLLEADESGSGPAFFQISDPDGNVLLFDQHVGRPGS